MKLRPVHSDTWRGASRPGGWFGRDGALRRSRPYSRRLGNARINPRQLNPVPTAVPPGTSQRDVPAAESGFTLAEVLAALLFLAIVIPTAVEALHVASLAGEVAARKSEAARVADRILNESVVTTNWVNGVQSGTISEGILDFRWRLTAQNWPQDAMQMLTAEVTYSAQGKDFSVHLSTLVNYQSLATPSGVGSQQQ